MKNTEQALIRAALPYWETEAAIVRRFFRNKPNRDDHLFWLKAQLWKELHPVDGYFTGLHRELKTLVGMFPKIDRQVDRHEYHSLLVQLTQEFNHYVLLADVFEYLLRRPITAKDTKQLPEEQKLGDMRRRYSNSGSRADKAAVLVTEGGGARMFHEGRKIKGGPLEKMIARAMDVIYRDEKDHYLEAAREAAKAIRNRSDLNRAVRVIREISRQRVYMRNEMFRAPLTQEEIEKRLTVQTRHP